MKRPETYMGLNIHQWAMRDGRITKIMRGLSHLYGLDIEGLTWSEIDKLIEAELTTLGLASGDYETTGDSMKKGQRRWYDPERRSGKVQLSSLWEWRKRKGI